MYNSRCGQAVKARRGGGIASRLFTHRARRKKASGDSSRQKGIEIVMTRLFSVTHAAFGIGDREIERENETRGAPRLLRTVCLYATEVARKALRRRHALFRAGRYSRYAPYRW